jgi:hypothetical protein
VLDVFLDLLAAPLLHYPARMRCRIFPTLVLLASGCGGSTSGVTRGAPVADASTGADGGGLVGDASSDVVAEIDGQACTFVASSYGQSCATNTDCVAVRLGDYCDPTRCYCDETLGAINATALAQFSADVAKTPIGSDAVSPQGMCSCLGYSDPGACCVGGVCQFSPATCPSDTLAACAEAGGGCVRHVEDCGPMRQGPPGSCAHPDETCCLSVAPPNQADAADDGRSLDSPAGDGRLVDGPADGAADLSDAGDAACSALFTRCTQDSECCAPYRCLNITGTRECQLEGPTHGDP